MNSQGTTLARPMLAERELHHRTADLPADPLGGRTAPVQHGSVVPIFDHHFFKSFAEPPQPTATPEPGVPANALDHRSCVLVVEDDRMVRELICDALEDEGISVDSAADGPEALEHIYASQPGLVLLDLRLPVLSGEQVADGVRARYDGDVPIVVMSSYYPAAEARRLRASAFLDKPFHLDDLVSTVRRVLGG